ncbi:MAG: HAMP domain-containing histidine kinase [Bacteroidales bacterium]|nr:HAMP domain-containing histidine kinase [Bacteroidales bacterium]
MNKNWLSLIILFICLALAGIIVVQYLWIRNAMAIRENQFNQRVNDALGTAVTRLETNENISLLSARLVSDSILNLIQSYAKDSLVLIQDQIDGDQLHNALSGFSFSSVDQRIIRTDPKIKKQFATQPRLDYEKQLAIQSRLEYEKMLQEQEVSKREQENIEILLNQLYDQPIQENDWVTVQFEWETSQIQRLDSVWVVQEQLIQHYGNEERNPRRSQYRKPADRNDPAYGGSRTMVIQQTEEPGYTGSFHFRSIPPTPVVIVPPPPPAPAPTQASRILEEKIKRLDKRASQLQDLIQRMAVEFEEIPKTVESRIDKTLLENTLKSSLADKEITIPFEFAVFSSQNDTNPICIRSQGYIDSHEAADHLVSLFPNDVIEKPDQLLVYFPGQKRHILKSLSVLMMGSILFTLIIGLSSGLSIFVIVRQKKISDIKTDFINNMTHEFKTPIATISIAADSINNPKVIGSPEQIKSYTRIIKEENIRMNTRVEQVLQMSLLDSRDFKLHLEPLNLHELISRTVDHFRLIVEKRGGTIETRFEGSNPFVLADEGHMRNVLMNLLDNANKYSVAQPNIIISTGNLPGYFFFCVEDKGIGMNQDIQKKVFEKFFRVTTGNVHNIKGFGLGLSYVKAIILAHKGEIQLKSESGKGSRFEISLPVGIRDSERGIT